LDYVLNCFVQRSRRNNSPPDETIIRFEAERWKPRMGYQGANKTADRADRQTGDSQMRTFSFILAFAYILAGPTLAGSSDGNLPGTGTFAYNGSPIAVAPQAIVVAAR
jgi:hypothetical protein